MCSFHSLVDVACCTVSSAYGYSYPRIEITATTFYVLLKAYFHVAEYIIAALWHVGERKKEKKK